jgi:hypothetical protein
MTHQCYAATRDLMDLQVLVSPVHLNEELADKSVFGRSGIPRLLAGNTTS